MQHFNLAPQDVNCGGALTEPTDRGVVEFKSGTCNLGRALKDEINKRSDDGQGSKPFREFGDEFAVPAGAKEELKKDLLKSIRAGNQTGCIPAQQVVRALTQMQGHKMLAMLSNEDPGGLYDAYSRDQR